MLNDVTIRKLAPPESGVRQVPDGKVPGFGVRVTANGVKSFYLSYRFQGRSRRINLGGLPHRSGPGEMRVPGMVSRVPALTPPRRLRKAA